MGPGTNPKVALLVLIIGILAGVVTILDFLINLGIPLMPLVLVVFVVCSVIAIWLTNRRILIVAPVAIIFISLVLVWLIGGPFSGEPVDESGGKPTKKSAGKSVDKSVEITNPLPPDRAPVKLSKGQSNKGTFRVSGTVSNIEFESRGLYVLATDRHNPGTWWVYEANYPVNGRWNAELPAGDVKTGKRIRLVALVTDYKEVESIPEGKDGAQTVRSPDDLSPEIESDPVVVILGPLVEPP